MLNLTYINSNILVKVLDKEPYKFKIPIKSEEFETETNNGIGCNLVFTYTSKYPDELPQIEIEDAENFLEHYEKELLLDLDTQGKENLGMVMIFTLVSGAQEWLNVKWEEVKKERDEEQMKKKYKEEEAERKKFEGTRVTVETFLKWRMQFEDDLGIAKKREANDKEGRKLTGKELFITDTTLNESDLKFLDEGDAVKVDESLFQDMDDLDLDEEYDEDFDPNNCNSDDSS